MCDRFNYGYGNLGDIIHEHLSSSVSNIRSAEINRAIFRTIRRRGGSAVVYAIGVRQPFFRGEHTVSITAAITETSQKIIERAYGCRDLISPMLIALIYDNENFELSTIQEALPKSMIRRVVLYPAFPPTEIPRFEEKQDLIPHDEARIRAIHNCLLQSQKTLLENHLNLMERASETYGLTLPEFITKEMLKPNSKIFTSKKEIEQKTDLELLFCLLRGQPVEMHGGEPIYLGGNCAKNK